MSPVRKFPTIVLIACMATAAAQTFYGNGYTIIEGMEAETGGDLQAYVFKTIDAATVEDGLRQLLNGSGWALAQPINADPNIWRLYRQPWPDNKRTINPMPLGEALAWIAGDGWALVVDPVNRLVSFEVAPRYARMPTPSATDGVGMTNSVLYPASGRQTAAPTAASSGTHGETTPSGAAYPVNYGGVYVDASTLSVYPGNAPSSSFHDSRYDTTAVYRGDARAYRQDGAQAAPAQPVRRSTATVPQASAAATGKTASNTPATDNKGKTSTMTKTANSKTGKSRQADAPTGTKKTAVPADTGKTAVSAGTGKTASSTDTGQSPAVKTTEERP